MIKSLAVATLLGAAALLSSCGWVAQEERVMERRFVSTAVDSLVTMQQSALEEPSAFQQPPPAGSSFSAPGRISALAGVTRNGVAARPTPVTSTQLCTARVRKIDRICPLTGRRQRLVVIAGENGTVQEIREELDTDV